MLIWPFLGKNSYFCNWSLLILKPIYHLFTCELGNLGCLGRPEAAKKVINSHQNIIKVAKTPYFITYPGFSPGSICRFCLKVVQMCSFACPSTSRNQFGCLISAGLRPKKTALCGRPLALWLSGCLVGGSAHWSNIDKQFPIIQRTPVAVTRHVLFAVPNHVVTSQSDRNIRP